LTHRAPYPERKRPTADRGNKSLPLTVRATLQQGLYGWEVTDVLVTLTYNAYYPRQSHAHARFDKSMSSTGADFRGLTALVLMEALRRAGTTVCEPLLRFDLEIPDDCYGPLPPVLSRLSAVPGGPVVRGATCLVDGEIPAARVHDLQRARARRHRRVAHRLTIVHSRYNY
jgi:ribosomal protection tetracycline resistance protein